MEPEARLPTGLWVDACLALLNARGVFYYIVNKGPQAGGMVLLKINGLDGRVMLLTQQRDFDGALGWVNALGDEFPPEDRVDAYMKRAVDRDPDLWVIEIEDPALGNPFDI